MGSAVTSYVAAAIQDLEVVDSLLSRALQCAGVAKEYRGPAAPLDVVAEQSFEVRQLREVRGLCDNALVLLQELLPGGDADVEKDRSDGAGACAGCSDGCCGGGE